MKEPKEWRRWAGRISVALLVAYAIAVVAFAPAWNERPPDLGRGRDLVRLDGEGRTSSGVFFWTGSINPWTSWVSNDDATDISVSVSFTRLVGGGSGVHGGTADLVFVIERLDEDALESEPQQQTYRVSGLAVGDTLSRGPVTIEVVAIHDLFFNRNNAVDLRVTFDESRLDEAP